MRKQVGGLGPLSRLERVRGPLLLAVLAAIPGALHLLSDPGPEWGGTFSILNSLGTLLGLVGLGAFSLNLALGARYAVVDAIFGGLDRMYRVHRLNGETAYLLLLGHAVLMFWARATLSFDAAVDLVSGGAGWAVTIGVIALALMTIAILVTVYVRLNHEVFVYVQRSFGVIYLLALLHVFQVPAAGARGALLGYILVAYAVAGIASFAYRSLFDDVLVRRRDYAVVEANHLDDEVTEIVMAPRDEPLQHRPGQFVYVTFDSPELRNILNAFTVEMQGRSAMFTLRPGEIEQQFHPFSITSAAGSENLSICVKAVGDYTRAMRSLLKGASARVEGPYGGFTIDSARSRSHVWIAGGIGVTPFLSMARSLDGRDLEVDLYYATKTRRQAHFEREFESISDRVAGFRVFQVVEETDGYVSADMIASRSGGLAGKDVFICGPPPMIHSLTAQVANAGVPRKRIHYEIFGFAR